MVPDPRCLLSRVQGGTALYPQEPPAFEGPLSRMSAEELGGYYVPIRKGLGTQGSAEVVIDLHWTIQIT